MSQYEDILKQELAKVAAMLDEKRHEVENILKGFVIAIKKAAADALPSKDTIISELAKIVLARAGISSVILVPFGWLINPLVKSLVAGALNSLLGKNWYENIVKLING